MVFLFRRGTSACHDDGAFRSDHDAGHFCPARHQKHFSHDVACVDVGRQQNIDITADRALEAFAVCNLPAHGAIIRYRSLHDAPGDLTAQVHLLECICFHGFRHFGIHLFDTGDHCDLRAFVAHIPKDTYGVLNDGFLLLQGWVCDHATIHRDQQLVVARHLKGGEVTHNAALSQTVFLVDNSLQQHGRVHFALHQEVSLARADQSNSSLRCVRRVGNVVNVLHRDVLAQIH